VEDTDRVRIRFVIIVETFPICGIGGHRDQLIDHTVTLLIRKLMIVSVEYRCDFALHQQMVNRGVPSWPVCVKSRRDSVGVVAAPLGVWNRVSAAAPVVFSASY